MRYVFRFGLALALGLALMAGCSDENGEGGSGGTAGTGATGGTGGTIACVDNVCACTEAGILAAIAEGGGPFTFDCSGPTTVVTQAEIVIDNDVILDGEGNLTVDGNEDHRVFSVPEGVTAELQGFTIKRGVGPPEPEEGGGIFNAGTLTVTGSTLSDNSGRNIGGIHNFGTGTLTMVNSTVSGNSSVLSNPGAGIGNEGGTLTATGCTVWGNNGGGIDNEISSQNSYRSTIAGGSGNEIGALSQRGARGISRHLRRARAPRR